MKKFLEKWGVPILLLVILLVLNVAPALGQNIQSKVSAASLASGEPAQGEIYVGNVETPPPAPVTAGCCASGAGGASSTAGKPSCH